MKFVRFQNRNKVAYGYLENDKVVELESNFLTDDSLTKTGKEFNIEEVDLISPVEPNQLIAIGLNYVKHAEESGKPVPKEPMLFLVSPTAVIGDGEDIVLTNAEDRIDYEAELAIVIGKDAYQLKEEEALDYVFGYTINNDVSNRNLQKRDGQFTRAKSYSTYKPLGPVIETDIDPNNVDIKLRVNGEVRQDSNTNDLVHSVEKVLVHVSEVFPLCPGDVIITGTPSGVGPLKDGDTVEVEIEGIGTLRNRVVI